MGVKNSKMNSSTFRVSNKSPRKVNYTPIDDKTHVATQLQQYFKNNCTRILQGTDFIGKKIYCENNGFIHSIVTAYNEHHNIIIRPDDIWTAIAIQFSFYVNANAEKFRGKFVNFSGKKQLVVTIPGSINCAPYDVFVAEMTEEIHKHLIDDEVKNWILPNFSTTTKDDYITCGIVLMATMKKYFDYKCCVLCGIPSVTLEGTIEDWMEIKKKLIKLKTYNLSKWVEMLDPILDHFILAKNGKPDIDFWGKICHYSYGGSGPTWLSGWITAFTVFDEEGKWIGNVREGQQWPRIDFDDVASGNVEVDVLIDDGVEHKAILFAGHMGGEVLQDDCTIQPRSGWAMALKSEVSTEQ